MSQIKPKFKLLHPDPKRSLRRKAADQARRAARRAVGRGVLPACPAEDDAQGVAA
jgi:hypothetical protein